MSRSVCRRVLLEECPLNAPRDIAIYKIGEQLQPLRFRSALQYETAEVEIVDRFRQMKAEIVPRAIDFGRDLPQTLVRLQCAIHQLTGNQLRFLVSEVLDLATQTRLFVIQRSDAKPPLPTRNDVETPIGITVCHGLHRDSAARIRDPVVFTPRDRPHDSKFRAARLRCTDHLPISRLEDMQRGRTTGENHELQREQREQPRHLSMILRCAYESPVSSLLWPSVRPPRTPPPVKVAFTCDDDQLTAAGMSCSDQDPCPIYLELSSVSASGRKIALAGNLHGASVTLFSILLASDDGGATWKEPAVRIPGAALEQVQLLDSTHGWAAGETQVPLTRDPFFLITTPDGAWDRKALGEDGNPGAVQRFWFDTPRSR